jgi:hypothetical protein
LISNETNEFIITENDQWNIRNTEKIESKPFYLNQYFIIAISIASLSLIYYYWDNIIEILKIIKPSDDTGTSNNNTSENLIRKDDIELIDINSIPENYLYLFRKTVRLIKKYKRKNKYIKWTSFYRSSYKIKITIN